MYSKVIRYGRHELKGKHCYLCIQPMQLQVKLKGLVIPTETRNILAWADIYPNKDVENTTFARLSEFPVGTEFVELVKQKPWDTLPKGQEILVKNTLEEPWKLGHFSFFYQTGPTSKTYVTQHKTPNSFKYWNYALQVNVVEVK